MEDKYLENEINRVKDEIRNIKIEYLKKDSVEYRKLKEKLNKNVEDMVELKTTVRNTNCLLEKNNSLTDKLNVSNSKLTTILENVVEKVDNSTKDIKEMKRDINNINLETSKNTDNRLTDKQIKIFIVTTVISLFLGAGLVLAGIHPN